MHAEDGDEVEGQVQVLLHLRAVGVVGDEAAVKLLDARRAEARARVHVHHAVAQSGGGGGRGEAELRLARAGLARELRHLALAQTPAEEVVDAVAAWERAEGGVRRKRRAGSVRSGEKAGREGGGIGGRGRRSAPVGRKLSMLSWFSIAGPSRILRGDGGGREVGMVRGMARIGRAQAPRREARACLNTACLRSRRARLDAPAARPLATAAPAAASPHRRARRPGAAAAAAPRAAAPRAPSPQCLAKCGHPSSFPATRQVT